jgi:hypothetical protein
MLHQTKKKKPGWLLGFSFKEYGKSNCCVPEYE